MRKKSVKNTRVNSEVHREISEIIREVKDSRVGIMTSVTDVEVTPDLKYANIYISALGSEDASAKTLEGLKAANGFIRRELARRLNLRNTPELRFLADDSLAYGMKMDKLINELMQNTKSEVDTEVENE
jgi:ribosome-binding factor A